jgi:hypothetical protein
MSSRIPGGPGLVSMTVPGRDLGEFLASMLGQRRTVRQRFDARFTIDLNWILQATDLITQRIASQNVSSLIAFSAKLSFKNGRSVELSSIDQLRSYFDGSDDISYAFAMRMSYLVNFPYRSEPEKQDIVLFASAGTATIESRLNTPSRFRSVLLPLQVDESALWMTVYHTDISFAEDIISLVSSAVVSRFPKRPKWVDNAALKLRSIKVS